MWLGCHHMLICTGTGKQSSFLMMPCLSRRHRSQPLRLRLGPLRQPRRHPLLRPMTDSCRMLRNRLFLLRSLRVVVLQVAAMVALSPPIRSLQLSQWPLRIPMQVPQCRLIG